MTPGRCPVCRAYVADLEPHLRRHGQRWAEADHRDIMPQQASPRRPARRSKRRRP